jgi:hypothetical protein
VKEWPRRITLNSPDSVIRGASSPFFPLLMHQRGQQITGIISGTLTDASGAVVPGAVVKLTLDATGESKSVTTKANGMFAFLDIFAGCAPLLGSGTFYFVFDTYGTNVLDKNWHRY